MHAKWQQAPSYDSEFQTEGALTQNAFADNVSDIRGTASNSLAADRRVRVGDDVRQVELVGWVGLVCDNSKLVADSLPDWKPVKLST